MLPIHAQYIMVGLGHVCCNVGKWNVFKDLRDFSNTVPLLSFSCSQCLKFPNAYGIKCRVPIISKCELSILTYIHAFIHLANTSFTYLKLKVF